MKILVVGLGSMGKRRIRLIRELFPLYEIIGVDGRLDRRDETSSLFNMQCYGTIEQVIDKGIDAAFVCTSPLSHGDIINVCLENGWNVFTEINLVSDKYIENMKLAQEKEKVLFLSSTMLYREEINYIRSKIKRKKKWNYIYHIGQYLPDWHPWESYNNFFVGDKRTNGCREIMAIEFPWLVSAFGEIKSIKSNSNRITDLDIDYDDNYILTINHENGNKGALIIDVVSPVAVRKLEIYSENEYIKWEGTPTSLEEYDFHTKQLGHVSLNEKEEHIQGYSMFVVENAYKNEIIAFIESISGQGNACYGFKDDLDILRIIDSVETR